MSYREATVYFYTGTGNSYRVAVWMTTTLAEEGATVTLRPIESSHPEEEIGDGAPALLGLVVPTHGFTTPWAMLRFALGLPRRRGTHVVVVATRAGMRIGSLYTPGFEGTATLVVAVILAVKGYRIQGTAAIDMPSNWIALHPALSPQAASGIVSRAKERTACLMRAVLSSRRHFANWLVALLGLLVLPISVAYLIIGRLFLAKLFFASDRCTGCGLCAKHCPNGAIKMRGGGEDAGLTLPRRRAIHQYSATGRRHMKLEDLTTRMLRQAEGIRQLVQSVSDTQARWKPYPSSWSILEVINHLVDEEREDFRPRLDLVLHHPEEAWQSIDPERWVTERRYNQRGLDQSREAFLTAREESIAWLKELAAPDWAAEYEAPLGRIVAGDIMAAWVAHDLLHLRQIVELHWAYLVVQVEPYSVRYAGAW